MSIAILLVTQIARHDSPMKYSDSQTALPLHHATAQTERADARLAYTFAGTSCQVRMAGVRSQPRDPKILKV